MDNALSQERPSSPHCRRERRWSAERTIEMKSTLERKTRAAVAGAAHGSASTHDYTKRHWGHDYTITDVRKRGMEISMMGWGHGISEGDYMLIEGQSKEPGANPDTRYQVKTIRYLGDPPDMWSMEATFAPRMTPNDPAMPTASDGRPLT